MNEISQLLANAGQFVVGATIVGQRGISKEDKSNLKSISIALFVPLATSGITLVLTLVFAIPLLQKDISVINEKVTENRKSMVEGFKDIDGKLEEEKKQRIAKDEKVNDWIIQHERGK